MKKIFPPLLLSMAILLSGCGEKIEPGNRERQNPPVAGLKTAVVSASDLSGVDSYTATVESRDRAVLTARTDGRVAEIAVREGEEVKAGALLLTIRDNQAADRLQEAQAALEEARQQLAAARARAELAQKTYQRYEQLFRNEAVTAQEMDQARAEMQTAQQSRGAAEAAVQRFASGQEAARTALSWSRVTAPYAARVVRKDVEEGSTVMPGTPLLVLDRRGGWTARAEIPEVRARRIRPGTPVRIEVPAARETFATEVSEIQPAADPRSRTIQVKAPLPAGADLASGLFARMIFPGSSRETILIPSSALVYRGQLTGVYLVRDGIARFRLVKTGSQADGRTEILAGLDAGDRIVVEGVDRVSSGARVEG